MDESQEKMVQFPRDLVEWAGQHAGGVKRLFDSNSGRPAKALLRTNLISRLEIWADEVASGVVGTPRILLLVGGPGNGKTEAIEHTVRRLDKGLGAAGGVIEALSRGFHPASGQAVPRVVRVDAGSISAIPRNLVLDIVQDATATAGQEEYSAPDLLIDELMGLMAGADSHHYLCCVNRGVLDDALIVALEHAQGEACELLESITNAVSLSSDSPSCWPLAGFPSIAVWPMDAESLLVKPDGESTAPAATLLEHAMDSQHWAPAGTCPAGENCPFCYSQSLLTRVDQRDSLLQILRWYEIASGKRWSFRDLFSLVSYLFSGHRTDSRGRQTDPCNWAASLIELDQTGKISKNPRKQELTAIFHLVTSSYQHAIFHHWDKSAGGVLRDAMKELGMDKELPETQLLLGLQNFLLERKTPYLPATIAPLLESLSALLDPALSSPDIDVTVSSRSTILLGELDTRFSRSLQGGIDFVHKYQILSKLELELLKRLAKADQLLSQPISRRKKPSAANRVQRLLRDFACRLVRRSICTRVAVVADAGTLRSFQLVVEDENGKSLHDVARQVKGLLNTREGFEVSLTTTFGQPLPPIQRQAILIVPPRNVTPLPLHVPGRPRSPISFLRVGSGKSSQPIALTYDLFKAVKDLERGLSPASLPSTVVALLDTTKARLSGPIVRDQEVLMDSTIRIGADGTEVIKSFDGFVARIGEE